MFPKLFKHKNHFKVSATKDTTARQVERLTKESSIELEKLGETLWPGAYFTKNNLANIGDTNWAHIDPMKMLDKVSRMDQEVLRHDTLFCTGLVIAVTIPFSVPFLELCLEVGRHCDTKERVLYDTHGRKIMDFSAEGVRRAFHWNKDNTVKYIEEEP